MATTPLRQLLTVLNGCIKGGNPGRALRLLITNLPHLDGSFLLRRYVAEILLGLGREEEATQILEFLVRHFTNAGQPLIAIAIARSLATMDNGGFEEAAQSHLDHVAYVYGHASPFLDRDAALKNPTSISNGIGLDLSGTEPDLPMDELVATAVTMAMNTEGSATSADAAPAIPLMSLLETSNLRSLLDRLEQRVLPPNTVVCVSGQPIEEAMWIVTGELKITLPDERTGRVGPGAMIGHQSMMSATPALATLTAQTTGQTEVLVLSGESIHELRRNPSFVRAAARIDIATRVAKALSRCSLFDALPDDEHTGLLEFMEPRLLPDDTVLIPQGEMSDGLYVIVEGEVDINKQADDNDAVGMIIKTLGPGDVIGEISLITESPAVATAITDGRARVLFVGSDRFGQLTERYPVLLERLRESAAERLLEEN